MLADEEHGTPRRLLERVLDQLDELAAPAGEICRGLVVRRFEHPSELPEELEVDSDPLPLLVEATKVVPEVVLVAVNEELDGGHEPSRQVALERVEIDNFLLPLAPLLDEACERRPVDSLVELRHHEADHGPLHPDQGLVDERLQLV